MHTLPYRLTGHSVMARVEGIARDSLAAWCSDWFATPPSYEMRMETEMPRSESCLISMHDDELWVGCMLSDRPQRELMQLLCGQNPGAAHSPILADVLDECLGDLHSRLLANYPELPARKPMLTASLDGVRTQPGCGLLYAALGGSTLPIRGLMLGGAWVESIAAKVLPPAPKPVLAPRRSAVGKGRTSIELGLGPIELSVGELANIAAGDVLVFDASYRNPLPLRSGDGNPLCKVHLGRSDQHKAIQIFSK